MKTENKQKEYRDFDAKISFEISDRDNKTVIYGTFQNIRYEWMEEIEILVKQLDSDGKTVARAADIVTPRQLKINETTTFSIKFKNILPKETRLLFTYSYQGSDGGDAINWMQSFDVFQ